MVEKDTPLLLPRHTGWLQTNLDEAYPDSVLLGAAAIMRTRTSGQRCLE